MDYKEYKEKYWIRALSKDIREYIGKPDRPSRNVYGGYKEYKSKRWDQAKSYSTFMAYKAKYGRDKAINSPKLSHGGDRRSRKFNSQIV